MKTLALLTLVGITSIALSDVAFGRGGVQPTLEAEEHTLAGDRALGSSTIWRSTAHVLVWGASVISAIDLFQTSPTVGRPVSS